MDASGRRLVWSIHTSTWRELGCDGATHTYVQLCCGSTRVRVARQLSARDASTLDPCDLTAQWEAGTVSIRFSDEALARSAAVAAWSLIADDEDLLLAAPPDQPQVPLAGPRRLLDGARRLCQGGADPAAKAAAWRWLLLGSGYDVAAGTDAPDQLVLSGRGDHWTLAESDRRRHRRPPREPTPVAVWPRLARHEGD